MPDLSNPFFLALKAAISAAFALALVYLAGIEDTLSATFVALACTTPVVMTGVRRGFDQLLASAFGGGVTWLVMLLLPPGPIALAVAMFVTVLAVYRAGWPHVYLVAGFSVLYVFLIPASTPGHAIENRLLSLVIGVVSATVVNVMVSASAYSRIFRRRLRLVRGRVEQGLEDVVAATTDEERRPRAGSKFDTVFPLLWSLGAELGDARREARWRRRVRDEIEELHEAVRLLALVAHLGKELGLHVEKSPQLAAELKPHLESLVALLKDGTPATEPPAGPEWVGAWRRARNACASLQDSGAFDRQ